MKIRKISFIIIFVILIIMNIGVYAYNNYFRYYKQRTAVIDYMNEKYHINPKIEQISKGISDIYFSMSYNGYEFSASYQNGTINNGYMDTKLGSELYEDVVSSVRKEFNTDALKQDAKNSIHLGYYDGTTIPSNMKIEELLNQTKKDIYLSFSLTVKNTTQSDEFLADSLSSLIASYANTKGIDYVNIDINFVNEKDYSKIKDIQDSNELALRYIKINTRTENLSETVIKGSVYSRSNTNPNNFINTLIEE